MFPRNLLDRSRSDSQLPIVVAVVVIAATPVAGQMLWRETGSLAQPRFQTTATVLGDGRVLHNGAILVASGVDVENRYLTSSEFLRLPSTIGSLPRRRN